MLLTHSSTPVSLSVPDRAWWAPLDPDGSGVQAAQPNYTDVPVPASLPVLPSPDPLRQKAAKACAKLLRKRCDLQAFGWADVQGKKHQISKYQLTKHFTAAFNRQWDLPVDASGFLPELSAGRLANAAAGRERLYLRSKWGMVDDGIYLLIRFDVEGHKGHDPQVIRAWIDAKFSAVARIYWCDSHLGRGGLSGFLWLKIGTYTDPKTGATKPVLSRAGANQLCIQLDWTMKTLAAADGLEGGIEVKGGFLLTWQEKDEYGVPIAPKQLVKGTLDGDFTAKNPTVRTMEDVKALKAAELSIFHPVIQRMITQAKALPTPKALDARLEECLAACAADVDDDPLTVSSPPRRGRSATANDSKPSHWALAVCQATHRLKICSKKEMLDRQANVLKSANLIIAENGWGDSRLDAKRHDDLLGAFRIVHRDFDPSKLGKRPRADGTREQSTLGPADKKETGWIDDSDNARTAHRLEEEHPEIHQMIEKANLGLRKAHRSLLTLPKVAFILNTYAKNYVFDMDGNLRRAGIPVEIPAKAPRRMLETNGVSVSGSTVSAATDIVMALGEITMMAKARPGYFDPETRHRERGKCRTFLVPDAAATYPFLPGYAEAAHHRLRARQTRERLKHVARKKKHGAPCISAGSPAPTWASAGTPACAGPGFHPITMKYKGGEDGWDEEEIDFDDGSEVDDSFFSTENAENEEFLSEAA